MDLSQHLEANKPAVESTDLDPDALLSAKSRPPLVLVVDDSPGVLKVLTREVSRLGRTAVCFESPEQAVTFLLDPEVQIDRAIVDLNLGLHDGIDLLDFLARKRPGVRRVLTSGAVGPSILEQHRLEGKAHAVLPKPWDLSTLAAALDL
jgi:CheY-like chemotaxis protein